MYISTNFNTLFETQTGDGFRRLALRTLLTPSMVVVTSKMMGETYYKHKGYLSVHSVFKYIEKHGPGPFKVVVIDARLPRIESRAHKSLMKLCKGKQIAFINPPRDTRELSSAMELISVTKNTRLKTNKFSQYQWLRGRHS